MSTPEERLAHELAALAAANEALQATADRYLALLRDYNHEREPWSLIEWEGEVRRALADTSPPAQPPRPLAGKVARHLEDLEEPAAQPVALHPATVEACAQEAERYPMAGQSSLGMQAAIARRIRSLLSQPGGGR